MPLHRLTLMRPAHILLKCGRGGRAFNSSEQVLARYAISTRNGGGSRSKASAAQGPQVDVDQERQRITISPAHLASHSASVIFMHGLGDTANGFAGFCHDFALDMPHVRFICPTAPTMPVTLNGGMQMPSWYDIVGHGDRSAEPCGGIEASRDTVLGMLEEEAKQVGYNRCVLAGFSQGGAMALYTGLQLSHRLAGIAALSAYLPRPAHVSVTPEALDTPVLQCHGRDDTMVRFSAAQQTEEFLKSSGIRSRIFNAYDDLGHALDDEEVQDLRDWMLEVMPPR